MNWLLIVCGAAAYGPDSYVCDSKSGAAAILVSEAQCRAVVNFSGRKSAVCIAPDGTIITSSKTK